MKKDMINKIVIETINEYFETQEINENAYDNTVLLGEDSVLDSMGLVNVLVDIESKLLDEEIEISLTSEKALSRRNSPFRTVKILAEFIKEQINGNNE